MAKLPTIRYGKIMLNSPGVMSSKKWIVRYDECDYDSFDTKNEAVKFANKLFAMMKAKGK